MSSPTGPDALAASTAALEQVHRLLPGLGDPTPIVLGADDECVGQTLAALQLRGMTGATVLAITRGTDDQLVEVLEQLPREVLRAGDTLALVGSHDAIIAARALLMAGQTSPWSPLVSPRGDHELAGAHEGTDAPDDGPGGT